jgi:hypothetical protein
MPQWAKGTETAEAAAKAASGARAEFFSLKSGDRKFIRPLTDLDDIITIDVHMGVPTKPAPKGTREDKWPSMMSAVCQNADAFRVWKGGEPTEEYEEGYGHCFIHENMTEVKGKFGKSVATPSSQVWGLFVMREAVMEGGRVKAFKDVLGEFKDKDGKMHKIPKIVVASQSWSNFWAQLSAAGYMGGTITDRDYAVTRADNDYTITPSPIPTPDLAPGKPAWKRYTDALELMDLSVEKVIGDQSSPEYYGRFFDPAWVDPDAKAEDAVEEGGGDAEGTLDEEEAAKLKGDMAAAFGPSTQVT